MAGNANIRKEYGDWQTKPELALSVCQYIKSKGIRPQIIIEPTCGKGAFVIAALKTFDTVESIYGIEINQTYIDEAWRKIKEFEQEHPTPRTNIELFCDNIFDFDFSKIKAKCANKNILILGNPPWVTNSELGTINGENLPQKGNFRKQKGIDSITGKSNFDIAENITTLIIDHFKTENAHIALLLKNSVIKNIVRNAQKDKINLTEIEQLNINAKKEFDADVAAALLFGEITANNQSSSCTVFDFYKKTFIKKYGWTNEHFISDISAYQKTSFLDGKSSIEWRSGIKHDCSNVMELTYNGTQYTNKLNEIADIEDDFVYPLIKSSDIKNETINKTQKFIVLTQKHTSEDTENLKNNAPKTYQYLNNHIVYFKKRGSRIYQGRPDFCIFGVGKYSFSEHKVVVSGLYKTTFFSIASKIDGKIPMLDDTCYSIGFDRYDFAVITQHILNSPLVQTFIKAITFYDAKRVITKDILMRINLLEATKYFTHKDFNVSEQTYLDYTKMLESKTF